MLRKIDSKPILFKYNIGNTIEDTPKPQYSRIVKTCGHVINKGGIVVDQPYGLEIEYDLAIILNYNAETSLIQTDSAIYVDEIPTSVYPNGDYVIKRISPVKLRQFTIYLNKIDGIKLPPLYFEHDGQVLSYQLNFDKNTMKGYVPKNQNIPFTKNTTMWIRKPADITTKTHQIRLTKKKLINNTHYELLFSKVL